jgi:methyltransferase (TIGR00027 family)
MSISHTAAFIAVKLYGLTQNPKAAEKFDPFIIDFYERLLLSLPKHLRWYHKSLKSSLMRSFFIFSEELLLPGDLMHILCRKFYVTQLVQKLLDQGYEQVVNLGAGFDHQGAFLSQRGIPVFELDRVSMIDQKQAFLEAESFMNTHLHLVKCDVEHQRIGQELRSHPSFDPKKKTVFIAEGFFDYLDLIPSEQIVEDIINLNSKNRLVSTFFSIDELNVFHRWVFESGVSMVGESLKFKINRDDFVELLEELGLNLESEVTASGMKSDFVKEIGSSLPVMKGFYVQEYSIR